MNARTVGTSLCIRSFMCEMRGKGAKGSIIHDGALLISNPPSRDLVELLYRLAITALVPSWLP